MSQIQLFIQKHFNTLLLLFIGGGFLMLLVELLLTGHTHGPQLIAIIASLLGFVFVVAGVFSRGKVGLAVVAAFLLLSLTGVIGVIEHLEGDEEGEASAATVQVVRTDSTTNTKISFLQQSTENEAAEQGEGGAESTERTGATESSEGRREGGAPPPLAPLSLAGLALLGAFSVLGRKEDAA